MLALREADVSIAMAAGDSAGSSNRESGFIRFRFLRHCQQPLFEGRRVVNNVKKSIWDLFLSKRSTVSYCPYYVLPLLRHSFYSDPNHIIGPSN